MIHWKSLFKVWFQNKRSKERKGKTPKGKETALDDDEAGEDSQPSSPQAPPPPPSSTTSAPEPDSSALESNPSIPTTEA